MKKDKEKNATVNKRVDRSTHVRAYVALGVFTVIAIYILLTLFDIQVINYESYQEKVLNQITHEIEVNPERGEIYDTNGNVLATNVTKYTVCLSPQDIIDAMEEREKADDKEDSVYTWVNADGEKFTSEKTDDFIARFLSTSLEGVDYDRVIELAAKKNRRYEVVKKLVDEETADTIRNFIDKNDLGRQLYLVPESVRYYPYNTLAAHVIGFTNHDGAGAYGIENQYNNLMEGTKGRYITAQDAQHNEMPFEYETYVDAENGYNITTTLDMYVQYELENQLKATWTDSGATNKVCGLVMDVNTGGVIAMGQYPTFDLNNSRKLDDTSQAALDAQGLDPDSEDYNTAVLNSLYAMWKNKAVTELYEPGSTFKVITTAMALEEKVTSIDDTYFCGGQKSMNVDGFMIGCHKAGGHGTVTFKRGLQQSCNPTMMQVAFKMGQAKFYEYFEKFGYNGITGIDLPNEAKTIYHNFKDFALSSLASYSYGQTFKTTPLKQLTTICAIANGGNLVTPHVLKEVTDDDGNVIQSYETDVQRKIVSTDVCKTITEILAEGVSGDGAARNAYVKGYEVAAKTGTSQKMDGAVDANGKYPIVGSCMAYAPADNPKYAVLIMVDEPASRSTYGSAVAAPYVSDLMSFILPYYGYEPQYTEDEMKNIEATVSNYIGADIENVKKDLERVGISYVIEGDGVTVTAQNPVGGSAFVKENGVLYLYTGESEPQTNVTVPDLIGKTASAANKIITNAKLNIRITGATNGANASIATQDPPAGTVVEIGSCVTVQMRHTIVSDD